jgi:hydroxypyruvate isomerase
VRFDANVSILFPDVPPLGRPAAAAAAGFDAVELWWPFGAPVPAPREVDDLVEAFGAAGVRLVMLNLDLGDPIAGHHGLLSLAAERSRFRDNLDAAIAVVGRLGGTVVNSHFGNPPPGSSREALEETAIENLAFAGPRVAAAGATLVLEALNPADFPRYGLTRTAEAVALVRQATQAGGAPVRVLFDIYHVQRSEGDLITRIRAFAGDIGHVQVADAPDRGRPGTGEIAFERIFAELVRVGYAGFIGLEYRPSPDPDDTFSWLEPASRSSGSPTDAFPRGSPEDAARA